MRYFRLVLTLCLLLPGDLFSTAPRRAAAQPPASGSPAPAVPHLPPSNCIWDGARLGGNPDVCIGKRLDSPAPLVRGQPAAYSLVISNTALIPVNTPITVTDMLPQGLTVLAITPPSSNWRCMDQPSIVRCVRTGPLEARHQETLALTVTVGLAAPALVTNCASVAMAGDSDPTNNQSCVETPVVWPHRVFGPIVLRESTGTPRPPGTP